MWAAKKGMKLNEIRLTRVNLKFINIGRENILSLLVDQRRINKSLRNNDNNTAMILALSEGKYLKVKKTSSNRIIRSCHKTNHIIPLRIRQSCRDNYSKRSTCQR